MTALQLTMAILKPHIIKNPYSLQRIRDAILKYNFKIVRCKRKLISLEEAEHFYGEHREKFFYNRLVTFMTSGPSDLMIMTKENAIKDWRTLMGPTKVYRAQFEAPDSIRGQYGLSDTRNATHGSDSAESTRKEIGIFFPEFDMDRWFAHEEPFFRKNELVFLEELFIHKPIT